MNIFDKALEEISCINQDLIQLFDNSCMNISAVTSVKALKLGKLYKEYYDLSQRLDFNENYDINSMVIEINKKIKELENE